LAEAVKAVSPAVVAMLDVKTTGKTDAQPPVVFARSLDSDALLKKLNALVDHGTTAFQLAGGRLVLEPGPRVSAVITLSVAVHDSTSRRGRRMRRTLAYAFGGLKPPCKPCVLMAKWAIKGYVVDSQQDIPPRLV
jgi:hypothetical protein